MEKYAPLSQNRHDHCLPCRCGLADLQGEPQPVAGGSPLSCPRGAAGLGSRGLLEG